MTQRRDADTLVEALVEARRRHQALPAAEWADALHDAGEAYAVQDRVAAALGWSTAAPPGCWKSGAPSREHALTHAALPPDGVRASPADLTGWPLHGPGIEAEIALRLRGDIDAARAARLRAEDVDACIDAMAVSIEIVDSRWREGTQAPALLRLADLQSHAALVLGDWLPYARRDWAAQRCEVRIGAQPAVVRSGSHSLGDPAWLLPTWLRHVTRAGAAVPAGTVVTTGTWVGVLPAQAGDLVEVSFDGIGSARVQL